MPFYGWTDRKRKGREGGGRKERREKEEKVKDLIMYLHNLTHCKNS